MKRIPVLSNTSDNKVIAWALIDDEDHEKVASHRWGLTIDGQVARKHPGGTRLLSRQVLDIPVKNVNVTVVHLDDDLLNCQKDNLQIKKGGQ